MTRSSAWCPDSSATSGRRGAFRDDHSGHDLPRGHRRLRGRADGSLHVTVWWWILLVALAYITGAASAVILLGLVAAAATKAGAHEPFER